MEILDPDLWNDDGTPKRPSKQYMQRLQEAQDAKAVDPDLADERAVEAYVSYARLRRVAKQERIPSIGDVVHLWDDEQTCCRAAVVTEVDPFGDSCELHVFVPRKPSEFWYASHDEDKGAETWHWPEEQ